jgi:hypothetical protein
VRVRLALTVLLAALTLSAAPARAEGEAALERLTPEERAVLERRLPGLAALSAEKQELIVRNVERLRRLDPAQRALAERRFKAAREAGLGGRDLGERVSDWHALDEKRRVLAEWQSRAVKGLGLRAWGDLPLELRAHPSVAPLLHREWPLAFHQRFLRRAAALLGDAEVKAWEPPATLPEPWKREFQVDRQRLLAAPDPAKALAELRKRVLQGRILAVVHETLRTPAPEAASPEAAPPGQRFVVLGERLRALAAPAYAETLADWKRVAETKGPEGFADQVREMVLPPRPTPELQKKLDALQMVAALEAWTPLLLRRDDLVPQADVLLKTALVDELGMSTEDFAALPPRGLGPAGEARNRALREWAVRNVQDVALRHFALRKRGGERPGPFFGPRRQGNEGRPK